LRLMYQAGPSVFAILIPRQPSSFDEDSTQSMPLLESWTRASRIGQPTGTRVAGMLSRCDRPIIGLSHQPTMSAHSLSIDFSALTALCLTVTVQISATTGVIWLGILGIMVRSARLHLPRIDFHQTASAAALVDLN
jgi:hypothetical protein